MCVPPDNAVYDIPELATGNGGTSYHNMSTVSSYEVPLNTFTRQIRSQPVGEGPGNNGTLDRGFVDSFTSDDDDDEGSEVVSQDFTTVTDMVSEQVTVDNVLVAVVCCCANFCCCASCLTKLFACC